MLKELKSKYFIEPEKAFLDLFGYTVIGPDNGDRYLIFDEFQNIGFIQVKRSEITHDKWNKPIEDPMEFYMEVDSSLVQISHHRVIPRKELEKEFGRDDQNQIAKEGLLQYHLFKNPYQFKLKKETGDMNVCINLSSIDPYLSMKSESYELKDQIGKEFTSFEFFTKQNGYNQEFVLDFMGYIQYSKVLPAHKVHERLKGVFNEKNREIHYCIFQVAQNRSLLALNESFNTAFDIGRRELEHDFPEQYKELLQNEACIYSDNRDIIFELSRGENGDEVLILEKELNKDNVIVNLEESKAIELTLDEKIMNTPFLSEAISRLNTMVDETLQFQNKDILLRMFQEGKPHPMLVLLASILEKSKAKEFTRELIPKK